MKMTPKVKKATGEAFDAIFALARECRRAKLPPHMCLAIVQECFFSIFDEDNIEWRREVTVLATNASLGWKSNKVDHRPNQQ